MAKQTELALIKQLKRELRHQAWLRKNLPRNAQQQSQRRIFTTRSKLTLQLGRAVDQ
ncbi:hypothetical protein [Yoonia sp.]|uniref:hypothetical protein n=1 Tax=Yoonia sp. TaxID=2212373 RepID=UPI003A4E3A37